MWSRPLSALLASLLCSTQAFVTPRYAHTRGEGRCLSQQGYPQLPANSGRSAIAADPARKQPRPQPQPQQERKWRAFVVSCTSGSCDRRAFFADVTRTAVACASLAAVSLAPKTVAAKEVAGAPVDWKAEFGSVKQATDLVLSDLRKLTTDGDWEELMEQAKGYDLTIRKGLMGDVRKKLPKEVKADAMTYRNNITFDLIAVNKAARAGDKPRAFEILDILEADIKDFLNLEKRI